jgi:ABC-type branched-subunit amino acid transport system ATPase component
MGQSYPYRPNFSVAIGKPRLRRCCCRPFFNDFSFYSCDCFHHPDLAIARALMSRPKLLLLDEPSLGLASTIVLEIFSIIRQLHAAGVTLLLVEQNANLALQHADRGYVLEAGRIAFSGPAQKLLVDDRVKQAYLG